MHQFSLGLIGLCIGGALIITEIWLIYMVHAYTEKAEALLPRSSFVAANIAAYSQAGFIGKGMRNGFLTLVLALPGPCAKRGIIDPCDAMNFPRKFKRMLFASWGAGFLFFVTFMLFGIYIKYVEKFVAQH